MDLNLDGIGLGFVVSLDGILPEVLKSLRVRGRRWWIASSDHAASSVNRRTLRSWSTC
jgi:hypothetical protein